MYIYIYIHTHTHTHTHKHTYIHIYVCVCMGSDCQVKLNDGHVTTVPFEDLEAVPAQKNSSVIILQAHTHTHTHTHTYIHTHTLVCYHPPGTTLYNI